MIETVEQFKEVIEGNYGITDLKSYGDYKLKRSQFAGGTNVPKEEIERLSPDNINSSSFWEYIEKNPELAKDAVSFGVTKEQTIAEANKQNFSLACDLSTINYVFKWADVANMPILDIGAGYGMLKEFVEKNTKLQYVGVDVYPKIPGIQKVAADGYTLPPHIAASKFGIIVATNVFQHLSVKQRRGYYAQVEQMLYGPWSVFSVSMLAVTPEVDGGFKCQEKDGKSYCCHYGQYTEIQTLSEIMDDLRKHFQIMIIHQRPMDGSVTFHCIPKKAKPVDKTADHS